MGEKYYKIELGLAQFLADYIQSRPYAEVMQLRYKDEGILTQMSQMTPIEDDEDCPVE